MYKYLQDYRLGDAGSPEKLCFDGSCSTESCGQQDHRTLIEYFCKRYNLRAVTFTYDQRKVRDPLSWGDKIMAVVKKKKISTWLFSPSLESKKRLHFHGIIAGSTTQIDSLVKYAVRYWGLTDAPILHADEVMKWYNYCKKHKGREMRWGTNRCVKHLDQKFSHKEAGCTVYGNLPTM